MRKTPDRPIEAPSQNRDYCCHFRLPRRNHAPPTIVKSALRIQDIGFSSGSLFDIGLTRFPIYANHCCVCELPRSWCRRCIHLVMRCLQWGGHRLVFRVRFPVRKIIECGITAGKAPAVDADARQPYGGAFPKRGLYEVWDGTRIRPFSPRRPTALAMNGCG